MKSTLLCASTLTFASLLSAQVTQFGQGCPDSNNNIPGISVLGAPFANTPFVIQVTGQPGRLAYVLLGFSNTVSGNIPLPFDFGFFGNPGCNGYVSGDVGLAFVLDGQGEATFSVPGLPSGFQLFAQNLMISNVPGSLLDGVSEGIEIIPMLPTTDPVIASIDRLSARQGEMITLRGANLMSLASSNLDICIEQPNSANPNSEATFMRARAMTDTELLVQIENVPSGIPAGPIAFVFGTGQETTPIPFPGVTYNGPAWDWVQPDVNPTNMFMTTQSFQAMPALDDDGTPNCCVPCEDGCVAFQVVGNTMVATLPTDLCDGVRFDDINIEPRWDETGGRYKCADYHIEFANTCGMDHLTRLNLIALLLTSRISSKGLVATSDGVDKVIVSIVGGGTMRSYSYGKIRYSYDSAQRAETTGGVCDAFAAPNDPATASAALDTWVTTNNPNPRRIYDQTGVNRVFVDTLPIPAGTGTVVGATLRLSLRTAGFATNDSLSLSFNAGGQVFRWGLAISVLPGAGGTWNHPQSLDVCLNLADLPASGSGVTDILAAVVAQGELDIYIQDDTMIDCATLCVQRCR